MPLSYAFALTMMRVPAELNVALGHSSLMSSRGSPEVGAPDAATAMNAMNFLTSAACWLACSLFSAAGANE